MKEPEKLPSLEVLGKAIEALQKKAVPARRPKSDGTALALRLGLDLVAGVVVGTGIGLGLDKWLGTSPFLLVICFLFGSAGGALTLFRTANAMSKEITDESDTKRD